MKVYRFCLICIVLGVGVVLAIPLNFGCDGAKDARAIWKSGIKKCSNNDLLGPNVLYFGPSNNQGPGTVFVNFVSGGTQVSHLVSEYVKNPDSVIIAGNTFKCGVNSTSKMNMSAVASASLGSILPVSGELGFDLKKAKTLTIGTDSVQWDQLIVGPYISLIRDLPDDNSVKRDLLTDHQPVLARALKVKGLTATLDFSSNVGPTVKAKFPFPHVPSSQGGVNITGNWESDTKLTLTATSDFYIAGELRKYSPELGLSGPPTEIGELVTGVDEITIRPKSSQ